MGLLSAATNCYNLVSTATNCSITCYQLPYHLLSAATRCYQLLYHLLPAATSCYPLLLSSPSFPPSAPADHRKMVVKQLDPKKDKDPEVEEEDSGRARKKG